MTEPRKFEPKYSWGDISKSDIVKVTVSTGHSYEFIKAEDMYFHRNMSKLGRQPDQRLNAPRVRQMKAREDDILVCSFPKAGTHWIWQIANMLVNRTTEYAKHSKEDVMLEFNLPEEIDKWQSPRVLNTHYCSHHIPEDMIRKGCKLIYIQRNPKDLAVSAFNFFRSIYGEKIIGSWNDFLHLFLRDEYFYMSWFTNTLYWEKFLTEEKGVPILTLYYEDLKKDPVAEIRKVADFIGGSYDDKLVSDIADKCDFNKMKNALQQVLQTTSKTTKTDKSAGDIYSKMYRKGQVGDWKNWFTVAQNEQFDAVYAEKMKYSKMKFTYALPY